MKKFLVIAASMMMTAFAANAQEAQAQTEETAAQASSAYKPEANRLTVEVGFNPFAGSSATTLENGRLNASYSLNENLALRAGLGFGFQSEKDKDDNKTSTNSFSFAPGVVYSFEGTDRFTPYVGGELVVGTSKSKTDNGNTEVETAKDMFFGVQAFTGMNYYFAKNLYVGVEIGLAFRFDKDRLSEDKTTTFKPYAQPAVRLGWTF